MLLFADILKFVSIFTNGVAAFPVTSMSGFGIRAMLAFRQGFQFSGNSGRVLSWPWMPMCALSMVTPREGMRAKADSAKYTRAPMM